MSFPSHIYINPLEYIYIYIYIYITFKSNGNRSLLTYRKCAYVRILNRYYIYK